MRVGERNLSAWQAGSLAWLLSRPPLTLSSRRRSFHPPCQVWGRGHDLEPAGWGAGAGRGRGAAGRHAGSGDGVGQPAPCSGGAGSAALPCATRLPFPSPADSHFLEAVKLVRQHLAPLQPEGEPPRVVLWAHNSHLGARAGRAGRAGAPGRAGWEGAGTAAVIRCRCRCRAATLHAPHLCPPAPPCRCSPRRRARHRYGAQARRAQHWAGGWAPAARLCSCACGMAGARPGQAGA